MPHDGSRLDIRNGVIHYKLYAQDGTMTPMTVRDSDGMRRFVDWVQRHDRYTEDEDQTNLTEDLWNSTK